MTANVTGRYSSGRERVLAPDEYSVEWSAGDTVLEANGLAFRAGILSVNTDALVGTYSVPVTVRVSSGDASGTAEKTITVRVNNVAPELTARAGDLTVKRGGRITNITITAVRGKQNLSWTTNGTLPAELTFRNNGGNVVIAGVISASADLRVYDYTVRVENDAGTDEQTIQITVIEADKPITPETIETRAEDVLDMDDDELADNFENTTDIVITGEVTDLSEVVGRIETVTTIENLDLSLAEGLTEVKLDDNVSVQSLNISGNQSIKTVDVTGNTTLTAIDITNSSVDAVYAKGCENLEAVNTEGSESLVTLDVSETAITSLNVKNCANLELIDAKGCENLEEVNLEGCESLEYLDVSDTAITSLNVQDCSNLGTLNCSSCDISDLNVEGCDSLRDVDCSNNSLRAFDAGNFANLRNLECRNQQIHGQTLGRSMNFNEFLRGRGRFAVSVAEEDETLAYSENVRNLKAYDKAGNEILAEYDAVTGEAVFRTEPSRITYDYDTGFENVKMDVTVYAREEAPDDGSQESHARLGSNGGCASGFGIEALSALMVLLLTVSRKK